MVIRDDGDDLLSVDIFYKLNSLSLNQPLNYISIIYNVLCAFGMGREKLAWVILFEGIGGFSNKRTFHYG